MDSITHIAIGALIGDAFAGKKLGKRAMVWGAMAQSLPDIDFVASAWMDASSNLLAHRGITHSFLSAAVLSVLLAWIAMRWPSHRAIPFFKWILFFALQLSIHLLLDSMNAYGIGWLEPFSDRRFSFHIMFVADPFFSTWLGIAFLVLIFLPTQNQYRIACITAGITISSIYIVLVISHKWEIQKASKKAFQNQSIEHSRYFTTPTPLNNWLWQIVAQDKNGFYIGYRSVFDNKDIIPFQYFPRNDSLLNSIRHREDLKKLFEFSQGYYTVEQQNDTLIFNDLRFGQRAGWQDPNAKFVFRYYLIPPSENQLVIQSGRFAGWDFKTVRALVDRIKGE